MFEILIAAFFLQSPEIPQVENQFGVPMGASLEWVLEELDAKVELIPDGSKSEDNEFFLRWIENLGIQFLTTEKVPDPNPLFDSYIISVQTELGVCGIIAQSREMDFDEAMSLYDRLKESVAIAFPDYVMHESEYGFGFNKDESPFFNSISYVATGTNLFRFPEMEKHSVGISFSAVNECGIEGVP